MYTMAQNSERIFLSELEKILEPEQITKVLDLVHAHYFNPHDSIIQTWSIDDFDHPEDLSYEEKMKALAYLEAQSSSEHDSEYLLMEHYFGG